jgi:hypothetical protein
MRGNLGVVLMKAMKKNTVNETNYGIKNEVGTVVIIRTLIK